jgi:hypothetical protein
VQVWPRTRIRLRLALALAAGLVVMGMLAAADAGWPLALALALVTTAGLAWLGTARYLQRRKLVATPFPEAWRSLLERRVDFYFGLDADGRARFEDDVRIFLAEQRIYAAQPNAGETPPRAGVVDDEVRLLIAASAAILGHGMPDFEWPRMRDIVVFPRSFDEDYRDDGENPNIAGMVHAQGPILYSARDLRLGYKRHEGHNVGIHELAHVLDLADGQADGVPVGASWTSSAPWLQIIHRGLAKHREKRRKQAPLRDYAGTNEAEYFAVAVEAFFERPHKLRDDDPELYGLLRDYFGQDPASRPARRRHGRLPPA